MTSRPRTAFESNRKALRPLFTHGVASTVSDNPDGAVLLPCFSGARLVSSSASRLISLPAPDDTTSAVALAPRSASALVAGRSGFAVFSRLLQTEGGEPPRPRTFRPFDNGVVSFATYDSSGGLLALAPAAGVVHIYDCDEFHVTHAFPMPQDLIITAIAFHPDPGAMHFFIAAENGSVRCFDLATRSKKPVYTVNHHVSAVISFCFLNGGRWLACAGKDRVVSICKSRSGEKIRIIAVNEDLVGVAPLTSQRKNFVTAGDAGYLRMWDAISGQEKASVSAKVPLVSRGKEEVMHDGDEEGGTVVSSMTMLASSGHDKVTVTLTDHTIMSFGLGDDGRLRPQRALCGNLEQINDLRVTPCGTSSNGSEAPREPDLLVASNSSVLWVVRPPQGALDPNLGAAKRRIEKQRALSRSIDWSDTPAAASMEADGDPAEAADGEGPSWTCQDVLAGHRGIILGLDVVADQADGRKAEELRGGMRAAFAASASRDKTARVWYRSASGEWACLGTAEGHTDAVTSVCLSPKTQSDNFFIVTGANDRTVKLWSLKKAAKRISELRQKQAEAPHGDGEMRILSSIADMTREDSSKGGKETQLTASWTVVAHEKDINAVAVSPDGRVIASGSQDKTVKLWDSEKGKLQATCTGHRRGVFDVCFSPIDRVVASCSGDGTVRIWKADDGRCLRSLQGHDGGVLRATFMTRGMQVVSSGMDGVLKVWTVRNGECDTTVDAHDNSVWALDVSGDGRAVVTGGMDGAVEVWCDATQVRAEEAASRRDAEASLAQRVSDATRAGKWSAAADAALQLNMPRKLRGVVEAVVRGAASSAAGDAQLAEMVRAVGRGSGGAEKLARLLGYCRDWGAAGGAVGAAAAARVLRAVFRVWTPAQLCAAVAVDRRGMVEALVAHTGRHEARVAALAARASFVAYTLEAMRGLRDAPATQAAAASDRKRQRGPDTITSTARNGSKAPPKRRKKGHGPHTEY